MLGGLDGQSTTAVWDHVVLLKDFWCEGMFCMRTACAIEGFFLSVLELYSIVMFDCVLTTIVSESAELTLEYQSYSSPTSRSKVNLTQISAKTSINQETLAHHIPSNTGLNC
jgi:hypothetical protein